MFLIKLYLIIILNLLMNIFLVNFFVAYQICLKVLNNSCDIIFFGINRLFEKDNLL